MIIQIIVPNNEIQYGVECLKKANELLTRHAKNETTLKKYTEVYFKHKTRNLTRNLDIL